MRPKALKNNIVKITFTSGVNSATEEYESHKTTEGARFAGLRKISSRVPEVRLQEEVIKSDVFSGILNSA